MAADSMTAPALDARGARDAPGPGWRERAEREFLGPHPAAEAAQFKKALRALLGGSQ